MKIASAQESHVGMRRAINQDAVGAFEGPAGSLFIVCDGMGGHAGGEVASATALAAIGEHFVAAGADESPQELLRDTVLAGNRAIFEEAQRRPELKGMGSTIVALFVPPEGKHAYIAHVGDSRIYLLRGSFLEQITKDHTTVQRYIDQGTLTKEQALLHPHAGIISRTLGVDLEVEVELRPDGLALQDADMFVLCSDGLTGMIDDVDIQRFLVEYTAQEVGRQLVALANARGGYDNITVLVVQVGSPRVATGLSLSGMARISDLLREQVREADQEMAEQARRPRRIAMVVAAIVFALLIALVFVVWGII